MHETMLTGSPEHKKYMRDQAEAHIHDAMKRIEDSDAFTDDQKTVLRSAFWDTFHAITRTI
ncbi:MAG: hypothetical protein AAFX90_09990 [Pseudomonadota bacterium]